MAVINAMRLRSRTTIPRGCCHEAEIWRVGAASFAQWLDVSVASRSWEEDVNVMLLVEQLAIEAGFERSYAESR